MFSKKFGHFIIVYEVQLRNLALCEFFCLNALGNRFYPTFPPYVYIVTIFFHSTTYDGYSSFVSRAIWPSHGRMFSCDCERLSNESNYFIDYGGAALASIKTRVLNVVNREKSLLGEVLGCCPWQTLHAVVIHYVARGGFKLHVNHFFSSFELLIQPLPARR